MFDDILILEPKEKRIQIADRTFVLRAMPAKKARKFFDYINEINIENFDSNNDNFENYLGEQSKKALKFISFILNEKIDEDFLDEYITSDMVLRIVEEQNILNGMDDFIKKVASHLS